MKPSEMIERIFWKKIDEAKKDGELRNVDPTNSVLLAQLNISAIVEYLDQQKQIKDYDSTK